MDISGKVWVSLYTAGMVQCIDPALNSGMGGVDATITLTAGAVPKVYGSHHLDHPINHQYQEVTHDSGVSAQTTWGYMTWMH